MRLRSTPRLRGIAVLACALAGVCLSSYSGETPAAPKHRIVVYYLHHTFRCPSCNSIESLARAAVLGGTGENTRHKSTIEVKAAFPEQVKAGLLGFEPVNVDDAESSHFLKDFGTKGKIPVIVELDGEKVVRYTRLEKVWELLPNNKALVSYVQDAVKAYTTGLGSE